LTVDYAYWEQNEQHHRKNAERKYVLMKIKFIKNINVAILEECNKHIEKSLKFLCLFATLQLNFKIRLTG